MPLLNIRTSAGAFTDEGVRVLVSRLTEASWRAESIPDSPDAKLRSLAVHEELAPGGFYCGGLPADQLVALVLVEFTASEGVLDPVRRAQFAADLEAAAKATVSQASERRLVTSVTFNEVHEGRWGRGGRIVRLPEMAAAAGFEHLTAIAAR
ncbi:hypothetical protein [Mycobacteroides abscessus]|uniref:hypothetical protein n=1 Tax=Mycobacteroides abscessus TaxID=36809 RepID=UPI00031DDFBD|nr:hypothetical protein [Mycobacteroides abscessus]